MGFESGDKKLKRFSEVLGFDWSSHIAIIPSFHKEIVVPVGKNETQW